ncbi:hypothetical protein LINGRAHAP2_LOCUS1991 [Linum grandiflorum]
MWHRPDRVPRQFGMEQPIPRTEMLEGEVMTLYGHESSAGVAGARDNGAVSSIVGVAR